MAGSLIAVARQSPLNGGVVVPGAQLFVYDAGTTTKRTLYTTSAIGVTQANPVVADANGRFAAVWLNPAGGAYKLVLAPAGDTDPPASPFWTEDAIPVQGASVITSSFTGTLTGMAGATTGTVNYHITANSAGTGKVCLLYVTNNISGTSNTTAMTMTGLPAAVVPSTAAAVLIPLIDAGNTVQGYASIGAAGTTITFGTDDPISTTGFTGSGAKGVPGGFQMVYAL